MPFLLSVLRAIKHVSFLPFDPEEGNHLNDPDHAENACFYVRKNEFYLIENLIKRASNKDQILASCINKELEFIDLLLFLYNRRKTFESCCVFSIISTYTFPKFENISSLNKTKKNSYSCT